MGPPQRRWCVSITGINPDHAGNNSIGAAAAAVVEVIVPMTLIKKALCICATRLSSERFTGTLSRHRRFQAVRTSVCYLSVTNNSGSRGCSSGIISRGPSAAVLATWQWWRRLKKANARAVAAGRPTDRPASPFCLRSSPLGLCRSPPFPVAALWSFWLLTLLHFARLWDDGDDAYTWLRYNCYSSYLE